MGFRSRRRHRGNGQAGQGHQGGGGHYHGGGDPNGLQPGDDVGNRKNFKVLQLPPEDIGNRKDPEEAEWIPDDDVGNRVDANPTHELSGILMDLDGKRRRRRPKGVAAPERVGRYLVGGVNPLVSGGAARPVAPPPPVDDAADADDRGDVRADRPERLEPREPRGERPERSEQRSDPRGGRDDGRFGRDDNRPDNRSDNRGDAHNGAPRTRRGHLDSVDPVAATQINDKRAQRFFDFEEDDRFEYTLKTSAEDKRKDAEVCVQTILREAGRNATAVSRLIEDGDRPKLLVTIDDRGASPELMPERRADNAKEPLFVMGSAALLSLNYLVNKIVNRYPNDRIRLAILPAGDERLYLDALEEHVQKKRPGMVIIPGSARPAPVAPAPVTLAPQPAAPAPVTMLPTAADVPVAIQSPAAALDVAVAAVAPLADLSEASVDAAPAKKATAKKAAAKKADDDDAEEEAPKKVAKKAAAKKADDDEAPKKATAKKATAKKAAASDDDEEDGDEDDDDDGEDDAPKKKAAKKVAKKKATAKKK